MKMVDARESFVLYAAHTDFLVPVVPAGGLEINYTALE
jgi:hypothetical protein